jgi:hypothetical protein
MCVPFDLLSSFLPLLSTDISDPVRRGMYCELYLNIQATIQDILDHVPFQPSSFLLQLFSFLLQLSVQVNKDIIVTYLLCLLLVFFTLLLFFFSFLINVSIFNIYYIYLISLLFILFGLLLFFFSFLY